VGSACKVPLEAGVIVMGNPVMRTAISVYRILRIPMMVGAGVTRCAFWGFIDIGPHLWG